MKKIQIDKIKVTSPMFSYGNEWLEPRPTELKGLLRNTYRIANPHLDLSALYQQEVILFGGQLKEKDGNTIKASPLRIQITDVLYQTPQDQNYSEYLLLHKQSPKKRCYPCGTIFKVAFTTSDSILKQGYMDLLKLSLLLGGIGKRSRRGRGCMTTNELLNIPRGNLPNTVARFLNNVGGKENYIVQDEKVTLAQEEKAAEKRPHIQEIRFGKPLAAKRDNIQNYRQTVEEYLTSVDRASHTIRSSIRAPYVTGFINPRFSSSVIVSIAEIKDGIVPVYTVLHAADRLFKNKDKNIIREEQRAFINTIEEGRTR